MGGEGEGGGWILWDLEILVPFWKYLEAVVISLRNILHRPRNSDSWFSAGDAILGGSSIFGRWSLVGGSTQWGSFEH